MPAVMRLDQNGAGVEDFSRFDGTSDGATITVNNMYPGTVNSLAFWWLPLEQATEPTLTPVGDTWTFAMDNGVWGPVLLQLTVDGETTIRGIYIPSPNLGLILPGLNEVCDENANLQLMGAEQIAACTANAPVAGTRLSGGNSSGWWYALDKALRALDAMQASKADVLMAVSQSSFSADRQLAAADFASGAHPCMEATNGTDQTLEIATAFSVDDMPIGASITIDSTGAGRVIIADEGGNTILERQSKLAISAGGVGVLWRRSATVYRLTGDTETV